MNLTTINKYLHKHEPLLTMYKGPGYFYYTAEDSIPPESIYTNTARDITIDDLTSAVGQYRESKKDSKIYRLHEPLLLDGHLVKKGSLIRVADKAEKAFEDLMKVVLKGTMFEGKAFAVGGYVRDEVLGINSNDLDIMVSLESERGKAEPEGAEKLTYFLHRLFPQETHEPLRTGKGYPIWRLIVEEDIIYKGVTYNTDGAKIEFADSMKESFPDPNSRQREVEWGTVQEDIERRDFTVNSLLKDLTTGEILDLTGTSVADIKKGLLRGNPNVDFNSILRQDPLRIIRLIRFAVKYDWDIPLSAIRAVRKNAERIKIVSSERIMEELTKIMVLGKLHKAIKLMKTLGILSHFLPEIDALRGVEQHPDHHAEGDVYKHTLEVLKNAPKTLEGQLAALLHDVGKPATQEILEDAIHFYRHEEVSAEMAEAILRRLKFDGKTIDTVVTLVKNHMRPHGLGNSSPKAFRKLIRDLGDEMTEALLDLAEADSLGSFPVENVIPELRDKIQEVKNSPLKVKNRAILDGREIMEALGIRKPGPVVGQAGNFLLDLEDNLAVEGKKLTKEDAKEHLIEWSRDNQK